MAAAAERDSVYLDLESPLDRAKLDIIQDSDDTIYISASVGMVRNNLILVLWNLAASRTEFVEHLA